MASIICVFAAHVAALDPLRQIDLLVGGQERHLADLAQVEPERVERRLDREIELRRVLLLFDERLLVRKRLVLLALDELDAVVDQIGREILELLLGELDLFEPGDDLVVGEKALFLSGLDELVQLFDLRKRDVNSEHLTPTSDSS